MLSTPQIQAFINANPRTFRQGATLTEEQLCAIFSIPRPTITNDFATTAKALSRFHLSKLSAYTKLNRVLSRCGLVIRQEADGRFYRLQDAEGTVKRIIGLASEAAGKRASQRQLTDGYSNFGGRWEPELPSRT